MSADVRLTTPAALATPAAARSCRAEVGGVKVENPQPDYDLDNSMADYANSSKGWTGGDGGQSIELPGGKIEWLDDDIYLGKVVGEARVDSVFLHNALVIQSGTKFKTMYGLSGKKPLEFMNYDNLPAHWYWSDGAIVSGKTLYVSYSSYYYRGTPSVFGFVRTSTVLAGFSLPNLHLVSVTPLSKKQGILWGISMMNSGSYTYIYGTRTRTRALPRRTTCTSPGSPLGS